MLFKTTTATGELNLAGKMLYGLGAASTGIKTRCFASFLMVFYNQVQGMPAAMVASVIGIATMVDAFIDPVIGQVSDNFRSRWGRRHPFMYIAALPTALAFMFIWMPPAGLEHAQLFVFMLVCLLVIRLFDTFYELPSVALAPELAKDYTGRTTLISIRRGWEMVGGLLMVLAGFQIFMREDASGGGGVTSPEGYPAFGVVSAIVIFAVIMISALATHSQIPRLAQAPARKLTPLVMLKEMAATLNNHAFMVIAAAGIFYAIGLGVRQALEIYFYLYFWEFDQAQISIFTLASVPGSLLGVIIAPPLAARFGKRLSLVGVWVLSTAATLTPLALRVAGLMPENGSTSLFVLLLAETVFTQVMLVAGAVLLPAMIADVVEDSEVKTDRRSEGLLFSADNLFRKFVSGIGVFMSGVVLTIVAFPAKAEKGRVDQEVLDNLALVYMPAYAIFIACAIAFVMLFRIDRQKHEENLRKIAARQTASATSAV